MIETYEEAVAFIHGRKKWKKTPTFNRLNTLLSRLDNPHLQSQYVHITGTNGKGSTSKMLAQLLRVAGLSVGLFTSPFIMRFNERIQDDQGMIADERLLALVQEIAPVVEALDKELADGGPTEFETLTALMFLYFARYPVDVVVLEVGIGGLWDSTNVVPGELKFATAITTVSYDHMHVLGNTLAEIAEQKAGIFRAGVPAVIGRVPAEATTVFEEWQQKLQLQMDWLGRDFSTQGTIGLDGRLLIDYHGAQDFSQVPLNLDGAYQIDNAGVALRLAEITSQRFERKLTDAMAREALATVTWPARFETLRTDPLLIIDGAHNVAGVQELARTIQQRFAKQTVHVIFGALTDKEYQEMLLMLADLPNVNLHVVSFKAPTSRVAIDPTKVVADLQRSDIQVHADWQTALATVAGDDPVIMTGSLYFVSEVRAEVLK